jgi:hypothetical protein
MENFDIVENSESATVKNGMRLGIIGFVAMNNPLRRWMFFRPHICYLSPSVYICVRGLIRNKQDGGNGELLGSFNAMLRTG